MQPTKGTLLRVSAPGGGKGGEARHAHATYVRMHACMHTASLCVREETEEEHPRFEQREHHSPDGEQKQHNLRQQKKQGELPAKTKGQMSCVGGCAGCSGPHAPAGRRPNA